MIERRSIAIVGAGIAGLTLAGALHTAGAEVTVLERKSGLRDSGAGISLWPNALAALDRLGLGDMVRGLGVSLSIGGEVRLDGRRGPRFSQRSFEGALGEGLVCVERGALIRALADLLEPAALKSDCAVSSYEQRSGGVTLHTATGVLGPFDAVVGADGTNSAIARQVAGPLRSTYSGYLAWRGIAESGSASDQEVSMCVADGHEFGWMPVGDCRTYWFATAWLEAGHEFGAGQTAFLSQTFSGWPDPIAELLATTPPEQLVSNDITDRDPAPRWVEGRVAPGGRRRPPDATSSGPGWMPGPRGRGGAGSLPDLRKRSDPSLRDLRKAATSPSPADRSSIASCWFHPPPRASHPNCRPDDAADTGHPRRAHPEIRGASRQLQGRTAGHSTGLRSAWFD